MVVHGQRPPTPFSLPEPAISAPTTTANDTSGVRALLQRPRRGRAAGPRQRAQRRRLGPSGRDEASELQRGADCFRKTLRFRQGSEITGK